MKKIFYTLIVTAVLTVISAHAQTSPLTWNWTLIDNSNLRGTYGLILGSGQITTSDDRGGGIYEVTSISGIYDGATITGLIPSGDWRNNNLFVTNGETYFPSDNLVRNATNVINLPGGLAFNLDSGSIHHDYWGNRERIEYNGDGYEVLKNNYLYTYAPVQFSADLVTPESAVPEPSTYVLLGLGALALVMTYRRKVH